MTGTVWVEVWVEAWVLCDFLGFRGGQTVDTFLNGLDHCSPRGVRIVSSAFSSLCGAELGTLRTLKGMKLQKESDDAIRETGDPKSRCYVRYDIDPARTIEYRSFMVLSGSSERFWSGLVIAKDW